MEEKKELNTLLRNKRDIAIIKNLETELIKFESKLSSNSIGIIFGANHMDAISNKIYEFGYKIVAKEWYDVIDGRLAKTN